jgi:hypothetical protein
MTEGLKNLRIVVTPDQTNYLCAYSKADNIPNKDGIYFVKLDKTVSLSSSDIEQIAPNNPTIPAAAYNNENVNRIILDMNDAGNIISLSFITYDIGTNNSKLYNGRVNGAGVWTQCDQARQVNGQIVSIYPLFLNNDPIKFYNVVDGSGTGSINIEAH